jgi:hypothetical protein
MLESIEQLNWEVSSISAAGTSSSSIDPELEELLSCLEEEGHRFY